VFAPVETLDGVTAKLLPLVKRAAGPRVIDLACHLPFSIVDRRMLASIAEARTGSPATLVVRVVEHRPSHRRGSPYRIHVEDETSAFDIVYFNLSGPYLQKLFPIGEQRIVSGRMESYNGFLQMAHPELVLPIKDRDKVGGLHPVYRSTAGLQPATLEQIVGSALARLPDLPEWIDGPLLRREGWPSWKSAFLAAHRPQTEDHLLTTSLARRRLAYDEILANQLAIAVIRENHRRQKGIPAIGDGNLRKLAMEAFGFELTGAQAHAIAEITRDMGSERRMLRLLQGDVGSGKTIVALLAMLLAVEAGGQAALMAPTEILARQHWATIEPLCRAAGVEAALLLGQGRGQVRGPVLHGLSEGTVRIVIGTHALAQASVAFKDLRLAVIDEQHRFGVDDRLDLTSKGKSVHTLLMSATPIPRTLTLSAYGELDISRLTEKPPGRQRIDTLAVSLERLDEVLAAVGRRIATGAQVYWVCPLVEETELSDFAAATQRSLTLAAMFGADKVGLVHGRLKPADKASVMERFTKGEISLLVATTVIEVGVNVPAATLMVIEHAERYGLAQLHQLRGRVGRGTGQSTCLLLFTPGLGATAVERLKIVRESDDGFFLAEEDLRLRGSGDVLGTRQSGLPEFRLADTAAQIDLVAIAHNQARLALERDTDLRTITSMPLRILLYLFERDRAVRYLRSG
jgi:ATP-dependent DNA helicase RecG